MINTAYIARLNATFGSRIAAMVRRGRALARQMPALHDGTYLVGKEMYFEMAAHDIRALAKLEGTVHLVIALIVKFMPSCCFNPAGYAPLPRWIPPNGKPKRPRRSLPPSLRLHRLR